MWKESLKSILIKNVGTIRSQYLNRQILNYFSSHEKHLGADADALLDTLIETMRVGILEDAELRKILFMSLDAPQLQEIAKIIGAEESSSLSPYQLAEKVAEKFKFSDELIGYFENQLKLKGFFPEQIEIEKQAQHPEVYDPTLASKDYFELHLYQAELKARVVDRIERSPTARILIRVPTGGGKTRIGLHTAYALQNFTFPKGAVILWLAYSPVLLDQAHETAIELFPVLGKNRTCIKKINSSAKFNLSDETSILFASPVVMDRLPREVLDQLRARTKLIIFDETHQIVANKALDFIGKLTFQNKDTAILGMTATPARADMGAESSKLSMFFDYKFDIEVPDDGVFMGAEDQLDEVARDRNAIRYLQRLEILAELREERHYVDTGAQGVLHPDRTKKIIELCEQYSASKKKILLFAENTQDAIALSFLLKLKSIPNALILGTNKSLRKPFIDAYRNSDSMNVLVSCEVLTTGFDAPETDVLLVARNTGSAVLYTQILGRGLRGKKNKGHRENLVLHVTDSRFQNLISVYDCFTDYMR